MAQDSFGQLHVRNDHANLQFRINGVELPEGINVFGQALQTRLANSVALITGSLPAQYGLRTTGVIDIQTKTGTLDPGGSVTMYGGQQETLQPSAEWGGRVGQIDYYFTGEYLQNAEGIENPAPTFNAIHDNSQQPKGFAYVSGIIDPTSRLTAILGASRSQFQIPQVAGQTPSLGLSVNGISDFPSAAINETQTQINNFQILAWQKHVDDIDFQIAGFSRYSSLYFSPGDPAGDLLFNGIAQTASRQNWASGVQGDGSWRAAPDHTVRSGFYIQRERSPFSTTSNVLQVDANGAETSPDQPISIFDSGSKTGWIYSYYLQDEWKIVPTVTAQFRRTLRPVRRIRERAPIKPSGQCGLAAERRDNLSRRLFALFPASPLRADRSPRRFRSSPTRLRHPPSPSIRRPRRSEPITLMPAPPRSFCPGSRPGSIPITSTPAT